MRKYIFKILHDKRLIDLKLKILQTKETIIY